jgi:Ca2+-binding RTX toxin-like protein
VGTDGDDTVNGSAADDRIFGREGDDVLFGSIGNDVLIGGPGSDQLNGDGGSDTFVYARGDGLDRVADGSIFETDRVRLTDVAPGEVVLERRGNSFDITIVVSPGVDEITLANFYGGGAPASGVPIWPTRWTARPPTTGSSASRVTTCSSVRLATTS